MRASVLVGVEVPGTAVRTTAVVSPGPLVPAHGFGSGHPAVGRHQSVAGT